jgi:2-polyprenyl-3-methyl-5-hydroxy-6-metoxy-1,4-benzoquinol methylase
VKFDYIYIPDVIEHIGNPVDFLESIRDRFKTNVEKIILTTPNAFRWNNFMNSFKTIEVVNTDHRFWFTPFTLSKIVTDAGYEINKLGYFEHGSLSRRQVFRKYILNRFPAFRDTLIIEISL